MTFCNFIVRSVLGVIGRKHWEYEVSDEMTVGAVYVTWRSDFLAGVVNL